MAMRRKKTIEIVAGGRMLITSPLERTIRRVTTATAEQRSRCVASLADAVFIPRATSVGSLHHLCRELQDSGRAFWALDDAGIDCLLSIAVRPLMPDLVPDLCEKQSGVPCS